MYEKLCLCYHKAAARTGMRLIPCGDVVQAMRKRYPFRYERGERSLCRDGYHMDLIYGRYLLAEVIYIFLFGPDIRNSNFIPEGADTEILHAIKQCICEELIPFHYSTKFLRCR